jgi:hypothetical protein
MEYLKSLFVVDGIVSGYVSQVPDEFLPLLLSVPSYY